jgi:inward rectifier potassium channel
MVESFIGLLGFAMASGLMFAKFSRPTARVVFSRFAVISLRDGKPALTFRMANSRSNQILEAQLRVVLIATEKTLEGETVRRMRDLALVRDRSPAFIFTWSAYHPIDEQSPFYRHTREQLRQGQAELMVTLTGIDGTFSQAVHTRHRYFLDDILWSHRLVDIITMAGDGVPEIDYAKFHDVTPEAPRV